MKLAGCYYTALRIAVVASIGSSAFADPLPLRTWVSSAGDDMNVCSRALPCATLAGALVKTAAGGEINAVDSADFGVVTISKSITIDLTPQLGGIQVPSNDGILISAVSAPLLVTLKGLDINGQGGNGISGVHVTGNSSMIVHIENSRIYGFNQGAILIAPTAGGLANVSISHTRVSDCTGSSAGISADATNGPAYVTILDSEAHNCNIGLKLSAGARADARLSDFSGNSVGVSVDNSAVTLNSGTIDYCGVGVVTTGVNAVARLNNMTIFNNTTGITPVGGSIVSFGNNMIKGNTVNGVPTGVLPLN